MKKRNEKQKARMKTYQAIKNGFLIKPDLCPICGKNEHRIEAHHHNGYDNHLDVVFACRKCLLEKLHDQKTYLNEENRGHRPPIYGEKMEKTIVLCVPAWLYDKVKSAGATTARRVLIKSFSRQK